MNYLTAMQWLLGSGMACLMIGILITKEPGQSIQHALKTSLAWGMGFLLFFGTEFMLLGSI